MPDTPTGILGANSFVSLVYGMVCAAKYSKQSKLATKYSWQRRYGRLWQICPLAKDRTVSIVHECGK
jgi:hypothetical protein